MGVQWESARRGDVAQRARGALAGGSAGSPHLCLKRYKNPSKIGNVRIMFKIDDY